MKDLLKVYLLSTYIASSGIKKINLVDFDIIEETNLQRQINFSSDDIGVMSCNPAMGGLGKGHLIREIDAMGGVMGLASDLSGIQFRMLNRTRGEAVQGPRAQIDRNKYKSNISNIISSEGIDIIEDEVINILTSLVDNNKTIK